MKVCEVQMTYDEKRTLCHSYIQKRLTCLYSCFTLHYDNKPEKVCDRCKPFLDEFENYEVNENTTYCLK